MEETTLVWFEVSERILVPRSGVKLNGEFESGTYKKRV